MKEKAPTQVALTPRLWTTIAIVASGLIFSSSCRIGNNLERIIFPDDTAGGYYRLRPRSVDFCVQLDDGSSESCASGSFSQLPFRIRGALTNPVAMSASSQVDPDRFAFFDPLANPLQVIVETYLNQKTWQMGSSAQLSFSPAWYMETANCEEQAFINVVGKIHRYEEAQTDAKTGLVLFGKTDLLVQEITYFNDIGTPSSGRACSGTMTNIMACYFDAGACEGENESEDVARHQYLRSFFGPYVDLGVLDPVDIPSILAFDFTAEYK